MRPVSDRFLNSLRGSAPMVSKAWVVAPGQTGVEPDGIALSILGGNVITDGTAAIRSTLDITVDGDFTLNADASLTPYGNEIFVSTGLGFGGGAEEYVSLGYFRIHDIEQTTDRNGAGALRITAQDRMAGVIDARLLYPIQFLATEQLGYVVSTMIYEVYPWAEIEWDDSTEFDTLGRALIAEEERFDFLDDLIKARGKIWYWDYRGVLVIKDVPSETDSVWQVDSGENGVLIEAGRALSREGVYNAVKAYGEAFDTTAPSSAVAVDDNPDSPTYYFGEFGIITRYYASPFITTEDQAYSAAESILRRSIGMPYSVDFTFVPNPALEPYDAVTFILENNEPEVHVVDRLTIPLIESEPMTADTREQSLVVIGEL